MRLLRVLTTTVMVLGGLRDASAQTVRVESILFVGNSLTFRASSASLNWPGNWGMAATNESLDYAHRLAARIAAKQGTTPGIQIHAAGGGTLAGKLAQREVLAGLRADLIIVQMGENDNQATVEGFQQPYDELISLLRTANPNARFVCTGVWKSTSKTPFIKAVCTKYGLPFADVTAVWQNPENSGSSTGLWSDAGVGWHPSDTGMDGYVDAIWNAFDFVVPDANPTPTPTPAGPVYPAANATNFPNGVYTDSNPTTLPYRYFKPVMFDPSDTVTKYPLVLFLHGSGQRGTNNTAQLATNANYAMIFLSSAGPDNQTLHPCFWVAPQCQIGWHDPTYVADQLQGLIDHFLANFPIDPDRVYLTGLSAGADGVTHQLANFPHRWAAAHAACGWGNGNEAAYKDIPMWIFHTADDTTVPVGGSDNLVNNLRAAGGDPIYTRYNTGGHGSAWGRAYNIQTPLVPWMMAQRRGQRTSKVAGPTIDILTPTSSADHAVAAPSIALGGTAASPSLNSLSWKKGGQTGTMTGTTNWTSPSIPLITGTNVVQVFARGVAYAYAGNGYTSFSDTLKIIVAPSTSFAVWQTAHPWNGLPSAETADPDGDGNVNLLEYAFGSSPISAADSIGPELSLNGSLISLTYLKDIRKTDLNHRVQFSTDLQNWSDLPAVRTGPAGVVETWVAPMPPEASHSGSFLRLRIERN